MIRKTRSAVIIYEKRGQEESNSSGKERVKGQKSGLLGERPRDDKTERSWHAETPALSGKSDEVIGEDEDTTIKVEMLYSEVSKPLTQKELVEKAKTQREVQQVIAREMGLYYRHWAQVIRGYHAISNTRGYSGPYNRFSPTAFRGRYA